AAQKIYHGQEKRVWADVGYRGIDWRPEHHDRPVECYIAMRAGQRKTLAKDGGAERIEQLKARVRAIVEHPFRVIKCQFGYHKVRYRGLMKNSNRLFVLAAFSNMLKAEKYLPA